LRCQLIIKENDDDDDELFEEDITHTVQIIKIIISLNGVNKRISTASAEKKLTGDGFQTHNISY